MTTTGNNKNKTTLQQISEIAGVSHTIVSSVIRGSDQKRNICRPELAQRIRDLADRMRYPRAPLNKLSRIIFLAHSMTEIWPVEKDILTRLANQKNVIIEFVMWHGTAPPSYLLNQPSPDTVIIAIVGSPKKTPRHVDKLKKQGHSVLIVSKRQRPEPCIHRDDRNGLSLGLQIVKAFKCNQWWTPQIITSLDDIRDELFAHLSHQSHIKPLNIIDDQESEKLASQLRQSTQKQVLLICGNRSEYVSILRKAVEASQYPEQLVIIIFDPKHVCSHSSALGIHPDIPCFIIQQNHQAMAEKMLFWCEQLAAGKTIDQPVGIPYRLYRISPKPIPEINDSIAPPYLPWPGSDPS